MSQISQRQWLRVGTKLMALFAMGFLVYVFTGGLFGDRDNDTETLRVDVSALAPGETMTVTWNRQPVIILHRTEAMLNGLAVLEPHLADPASEHARQPDSITDPKRSVTPQYLVIMGYRRDLGCPVRLIAADDKGPDGLPWYGGFRDHCRGEWYDPSGRIYAGQSDWHNLDIPPYRITSKGQLILGAE